MSFIITLVLLWYTLTMIPSKAAPVPLDNSVTPRSQLTARGTLVSSLHPETHRRRQMEVSKMVDPQVTTGSILNGPFLDDFGAPICLGKLQIISGTRRSDKPFILMWDVKALKELLSETDMAIGLVSKTIWRVGYKTAVSNGFNRIKQGPRCGPLSFKLVSNNPINYRYMPTITSIPSGNLT